MKLYDLSTGDPVQRYHKSIAVLFQGTRKVLSTSILNGGYREDLTSVFNHDCNPDAGMTCTLRAENYVEYMKLIASKFGIDPEKASGMGTAASMDNVAIVEKKYQNLTVTALVTGGIEENGGRVGDPATYFKPIDKGSMPKPGTINIILLIDSDMPAAAMTRALVTCTEAKTAALQELMAGSNYSNGLATGSGTDQTMIVANADSNLYLESAGKHAKLGELIGCVVKEAVKEALKKETGLSPKLQHRILRRFKRFGLTEETVWHCYQEEQNSQLAKAQFLDSLDKIDQDSTLLVYASLYIHLLDQLLWKLLLPAEILPVAKQLLGQIAGEFDCPSVALEKAELTELLEAWSRLLVNVIVKKQ